MNILLFFCDCEIVGAKTFIDLRFVWSFRWPFFCYAAISKSLDPVTGQMSSTIAAKLTAVEVALKENVTKVVKSKVSGWKFENEHF